MNFSSERSSKSLKHRLFTLRDNSYTSLFCSAWLLPIILQLQDTDGRPPTLSSPHPQLLKMYPRRLPTVYYDPSKTQVSELEQYSKVVLPTCRTAYLFYPKLMYALLLKRHSPLPLFSFRRHLTQWKTEMLFFPESAVNLALPQLYIYAKTEHVFWVYKGKIIIFSVKWILYVLAQFQSGWDMAPKLWFLQQHSSSFFSFFMKMVMLLKTIS